MARKRRGNPVSGWLVVDKPVGMTSTRLVGIARRALNAAKAGHGGTLDPLASGVLPIAFGEATKTVGYAMDGEKTYRFDVRWGEARDTDDAEGAVTETSAVRPTDDQIRAALPRFVGHIQQVPPSFSALKINGQRAYDLARGGRDVVLAPRSVRVARLDLLDRPDPDSARFEAVCGKGTYVRSLARDLAETLGTVGHVTALRRHRVGPFSLENAVSLAQLEAMADNPLAESTLLPIATALDDIPALALTETEAHQMRCGQPVMLLRRSERERLEQLNLDPAAEGVVVLAVLDRTPVALARLDGASLQPVRVLNL
ncbi:MAG: tRNA pseudouridine(55) synthase TruB [Inquilinaceae bacterium]